MSFDLMKHRRQIYSVNGNVVTVVTLVAKRAAPKTKPFITFVRENLTPFQDQNLNRLDKRNTAQIVLKPTDKIRLTRKIKVSKCTVTIKYTMGDLICDARYCT